MILLQILANVLTYCFWFLCARIISISVSILSTRLAVSRNLASEVLMLTPGHVISWTGTNAHFDSVGKTPNFSKSACVCKLNIFSLIYVRAAPMPSSKDIAKDFPCDRQYLTKGISSFVKI